MPRKKKQYDADQLVEIRRKLVLQKAELQDTIKFVCVDIVNDFNEACELAVAAGQLAQCILAIKTMRVAIALARETGQTTSVLPFRPKDCGIEI